MDSCREVPRERWNALASESVYQSWEWYSALESEEEGLTRYVVVRDGRDLLAVLPVSGLRRRRAASYDPAFRTSGGAAEDTDFWPLLLLGNRRGFSSPPILRVGSEGSIRAWSLAFQVATEIRAAEGWRAVAMLYVPSAYEPWLARAGALSTLTRLRGSREAVLTLPRSFDAYLAGLSSGRRSAVRREMRTFVASGTSTTVGFLDPDDCTYEAWLTCQTEAKYGAAPAPERMARQLRALADAFGERCVVFRTYRDDVMTAMAGFLLHEKGFFARFFGADYATAHRFDYFCTLFYAPIHWAIEHHFEFANFGTGSEAAKEARGAVLTPLVSLAGWDLSLAIRPEAATGTGTA